MKRYSSTWVILIALLILAALASLLQTRASSRLGSVRIDGICWDETTQNCIPLEVQIDDERTLAQVGPWRQSLRECSRKKALRDLWPLSRRNRCENSLRQPLERVTLVYEDGRREVLTVNIYATPFRNQWNESKTATTTLLFAVRCLILAIHGLPFR